MIRPPALHLSRRAPGWRSAFLALTLLATLPGRGHAYALHLTPTNGDTNQADLTLTFCGQSLQDSTFVQASSTLDFDLDDSQSPALLDMTAATLAGSDLEWVFAAPSCGTIDATNVVLTLDGNPAAVEVDPATGQFSAMAVQVLVTARISWKGILVANGPTSAAISMGGVVQVDPFGAVTLTSFDGDIDPPIAYPIGPITVFLSGSIHLDFTGNAPAWVFADGFEGGDTSTWSVTAP